MKQSHLETLALLLADFDDRGLIPDHIWDEAESLYRDAMAGETQADEKHLREILEAIRAENEEPDEPEMTQAEKYAQRVAELEAEGMSTSDAQGIADMELEPIRKPKP